MTSREFCYWLQGHFEIQGVRGGAGLASEQVEIIAKHLALVFKHEIDPSYGGPEKQTERQEIHGAFDPNRTKITC